MAESEDSFILIPIHNEGNNEGNNESTAGSVHSIDAWSEISVPSNRSNHSAKNVNKSAFNVFTGTYMQHSLSIIPGLIAGNNSDKGYYLVNGPNDIQLSNSTTDDTTNNNVSARASAGHDHTKIINEPNASNTSIGSRVPFSWAEITKIQPQFHNDQATTNASQPKVFDQTPKIQTRYRTRANQKKTESKSKAQPFQTVMLNEQGSASDDLMPSIPETNPYAGRKVKKSGKRGSRLRYANGKRHTKRNWKKKNQK